MSPLTQRKHGHPAHAEDLLVEQFKYEQALTFDHAAGTGTLGQTDRLTFAAVLLLAVRMMAAARAWSTTHPQ
jgi:hypothetical protein